MYSSVKSYDEDKEMVVYLFVCCRSLETQCFFFTTYFSLEIIKKSVSKTSSFFFHRIYWRFWMHWRYECSDFFSIQELRRHTFLWLHSLIYLFCWIWTKSETENDVDCGIGLVYIMIAFACCKNDRFPVWWNSMFYGVIKESPNSKQVCSFVWFIR